MKEKDKVQKNAKSEDKNAKSAEKDVESNEKAENSKVKDYMIYEAALKNMEESLARVAGELDAAKKEAAQSENLARVYRKDLERFKERNKNAAEEMKEQAQISTAEKLIPILDNFDQALKIVENSDIKKGFEMIEASLKRVLLDMGIEEIASVGKKMDPNLHEVVFKRATDDDELDGVIASEMVKGYKLIGEDGKVVRHAMVEVYIKE